MSEKLSKLFHEFVYENDCNGNEEIIAETNEFVAGEDIEAGTMLDDRLGEKYFYKCMDLAENVIKSFEDEQTQLNDNQQIVLDWLKIGHCEGDSIFESLERITYVYEDPKTEEALDSLSADQEIQVIKLFMSWAQEQEGE